MRLPGQGVRNADGASLASDINITRKREEKDWDARKARENCCFLAVFLASRVLEFCMHELDGPICCNTKTVVAASLIEGHNGMYPIKLSSSSSFMFRAVKSLARAAVVETREGGCKEIRTLPVSVHPQAAIAKRGISAFQMKRRGTYGCWCGGRKQGPGRLTPQPCMLPRSRACDTQSPRTKRSEESFRT
jgi:hypothetical protein